MGKMIAACRTYLGKGELTGYLGKSKRTWKNITEIYLKNMTSFWNGLIWHMVKPSGGCW
jgi:hypothetical protein